MQTVYTKINQQYFWSYKSQLENSQHFARVAKRENQGSCGPQKLELIKLFIDIFPFADSNSPFIQLIDIMHEHQFFRRLSASISISAVNGPY